MTRPAFLLLAALTLAALAAGLLAQYATHAAMRADWLARQHATMHGLTLTCTGPHGARYKQRNHHD